MELYYYKSDIGNFGDDLNPWLWNKIFGDFEQYKDVQFVGIGSILDSRLDNGKKKVIFGSGVRSKNYRPANPNNFDIRFLRGPLSQSVLNNKFISDAAYCLALIDSTTTVKTYDISFIPYFRHYLGFDWKKFSELTGYNIINPLDPIEQVIYNIKSSSRVISCAMHGAILSDLYRIPWTRCKIGKHGMESADTSTLKWNDFYLSMGINNAHLIDVKSNINATSWFGKLRNKFLVKKIANSCLTRNIDYTLSQDDLFNQKLNQLNEEIVKFKMDYLR